MREGWGIKNAWLQFGFGTCLIHLATQQHDSCYLCIHSVRLVVNGDRDNHTRLDVDRGDLQGHIAVRDGDDATMRWNDSDETLMCGIPVISGQWAVQDESTHCSRDT